MKLLSRFYFVIVLSFLVQLSFTADCLAQELERPEGIFKFSVLGVMDVITPHLEFGYEKKISPKSSIECNLSLISYYTTFYAHLIDEPGFGKTTGGRIRLEWRLYRMGRSKGGTDEYLAPMLMFKMTDTPRTEWVPYEENSYTRKTYFSKRNIAGGIFLKYGGLKFVGEKKKWCTDAYVAIGLKVDNRTFPGLPDSVDRIGTGFLSRSTEEGTFVYPALLFNYRFGFKVKE